MALFVDSISVVVEVLELQRALMNFNFMIGKKEHLINV